MCIVLSESSAEVLNMPLRLSLLITRFAFQFGRISKFICFKYSKNYSGVKIVLSLIVHREMKKHIGHSFFVDFFEVL